MMITTDGDHAMAVNLQFHQARGRARWTNRAGIREKRKILGKPLAIGRIDHLEINRRVS
jgi:hypothetical protein